MGRRSIRKQQIEAAHALLKNPPFVMRVWQPSPPRWDDVTGKYERTEMCVVRELLPLDISPSAELNMLAIAKPMFHFQTEDKKLAEFVCREKNAEAIVDAIRKIK